MSEFEMRPGGGVTAPSGFKAAASSCGLRSSGEGLDVAIVASDSDCAAAGVFTQNLVAAAPVVLDRETLAHNSARIRAVVANAGIANACTGEPGMDDARLMQAKGAEALGCLSDQVLVLSTGVIGVRIDMSRLNKGIAAAGAKLSVDGGEAAAEAILTTDTRSKTATARVPRGADSGAAFVTIGGMAKGSGMIHPDMATMLAVITTDAAIAPGDLRRLLSPTVERTFNRISVDGDTSTNDTVLLLANGAAGPLANEAARQQFARALEEVCGYLAREIVRDGEGAEHFISITVTGAESEEEAARVGRVISTSPLVKTAFAGGDPNWGRILAAAGRAGVPLDPSRLMLAISSAGGDWLRLVESGLPNDYEEAEAARIFAAEELGVRLDLGRGESEATVWTSDLTHGYITINADYRT